MQKKPLKVAILGFSREGQSILKHLKKTKPFNKAEITILDKNPEVKVPRGVKITAGPDYLGHIENYQYIFRSPGIPFMRAEIQRAIKHGRICSSATALFFEELRKNKKRPLIVGVTGTKGKGTTSTLIYECLKAAKINAVLAGNMGKPMLEYLPAAKKAKVVVLELSSFQLQDLKQSPDIAVVLHVTPDHMDAHQSLIEYYTAKAQIAAHQDRNAALFYLPNNLASSEIARQSLGKKTLIDPDTFTLFKQADLLIPGKHNFANAAMAATVARALGCSDEAILKGVTKFKGLPYRLAHSRTIELEGNAAVKFYNDSAATIPEATAAAIRSFSDPAVLISGGKSKVYDYGALKNALLRCPTFAVVLFGENRERIAGQLHGATQQLEIKSGNLATVVQAAFNLAKARAKQLNAPVTVLFSPASASFDMFKDWYDRSEQFEAIVKKLK